MKKTFLLLLLTIQSLVYAQQAKKAFFFTTELDGNVKNIAYHSSIMNNEKAGQIELDGQKSLIDGNKIMYNFKYDKNGNLLYQETPDFYYHKTFNANNLLIESKVLSRDQKKLMSKEVFTYKTGDLIKKETFSYTFGYECLLKQVNYSYNIAKKLIEESLLSFNCEKSNTIPKSTIKTAYIYDTKNKLIGENGYNITGAVSTTKTYSYDALGRKIKYMYSSKTNNIYFDTNYFYDKNGLLIESIETGKENYKKTERFKYDINKNLIEKNISLANGSIKKTLYKYRLNKIIEQTELLNDKVVYVKKLKYDAIGNPIEVSYFDEKGQLILKTELKIEYY